MQDSVATDIVKKQEQLAGNRATWESHWEEVAERVIPRESGLFLSSPQYRTAGEKRTEKMFDATASLGLERFAAAMESMLTPRNSRWHRLRASSERINRSRQVGLWFDEVTDILFKARYSPRANYASQQHENYMALGAFGTAAMFIDELDGGGIRYRSVHLSEVFFLENHQGIIDTAYRRFPMTARQMEQKWGRDKLPEKIQKAAENEPQKEFDIIHCVRPRDEVDKTKADHRRMDFASFYVTVEGKKTLSEGGYRRFPYAISRYVTTPGELYGRSPAMLALPSIKTLNEQKKTVLKQGQRVTDPVLLAHDDGVLDEFSLHSGAINYGGVSAEGRALVHTLPTGNLSVGHQMMEQERSVINEAFLVTLFQILVETPQMTATEVLQRAQEKGALLSPTMGRQQSEALGPQIERELDILFDQGMLPDMPQELIDAGGEFEIEYDSPLSRAQKAEEASGLFRYMEWAQNYVAVTQDPSPYDLINVDEAGMALMDINAVPYLWRNSAEQIQQIRQSRQQAQQQQQAIEAAPALSGAAKAMQGGQ